MSRTSRRRFLRLGRDLAIAGSALSLGGLAACGRTTRTGPPNLVLVLVDDLGVSDSSVAGSAFYETPALARMAAEGVRFTDASSPSPLCSSSRASILTGRAPHRVGITGAIVCAPPCDEVDRPTLPAAAPAWQKAITPTFLTHLPLEERTIAEVLRDQGYATGHVGKWHLGGEGYSPRDQGFDTAVGGSYQWSPGSHVAPYHLLGLTDAPAGERLEERLTAESVAFIRKHRHRPFFLSLWHYGVHSPIEGVDGRVDRFRAKVSDGDAQRNPEYASMVEACDESLGRILDVLDALGLSEDTLVVFTSDNGGLMFESAPGGLHAVTSNAPYRGGKAHVYEGGTRVPFVARWPGRIEAGRVEATPASGVDLFPTFAAVAGVDPSSLPELDGVSLLPLLERGEPLGDRALVVHFPHYIPGPRNEDVPVGEQPFWAVPGSAIRLGNEKLVRLYGEGPTRGGGLGSDRFELYDLAADPGETTDLAAERPDRVIALAATLSAHLAGSGAVIPIPNPAFARSFGGFRVLSDATVDRVDGGLRVVATGSDPALVSGVVAIDRPSRLVARVRTASATNVDVYYATTANPSFSESRKLRAGVAASASFAEFVFDLPSSAADVVTRLRVDTGVESSVVDLASLRVVDRDDPSVELVSFRFDGASDGSYGGVFLPLRDCTVACSAGALQVIMDAGQPSIASDRILLFGPIRLRIRLRSTGAGACAIDCERRTMPTTQVPVQVAHDGAFHEVSVDLGGPFDAPIARLVVRLGDSAGVAELAYLRAFQVTAIGESLVGSWEFGG